MAEMLVSLGGLIALVLTFFLMFMVSQPVLTSGVGLVTLLTVVFLFVLVVPHGAELVYFYDLRASQKQELTRIT